MRVREVTRTPDLPLRSGFVTQKSKERRAFPCPIFVVTHFVTQLFVTVELEANEPDEKTLFLGLFGIWPSHPESPVTKT